MENITTNQSRCFHFDITSDMRPLLLYYLAIIVVAIPSNGFSLYVSFQHIGNRNDLGVYLFNLALSDLTFTVALSVWLDFLWRGLWVHGGFVCLLSFYCLYTNFYLSQALLCCIVVSSYLAVAHPLKYLFLRKVSTAAGVSVFLCALVASFNATIVPWESLYHDSDFFSFCFDVFLLMSKNLIYISTLRFCFGFVAPVFLVLFFNWRTCLAVNSNQATLYNERVHISKTLTIIQLCLVLFTGPIHVMMLLRAYFSDCHNFPWVFLSYKISTAISSLHCVVDPFLYCFITRTGQENLRQIAVFFLGKEKNSNSNTR